MGEWRDGRWAMDEVRKRGCLESLRGGGRVEGQEVGSGWGKEMRKSGRIWLEGRGRGERDGR